MPGTTSVVMNVNPKKASVAVGVEEHLLGGRDHIRESLGGLIFQVSAGSFFQTNTAQAERLFDLVLRVGRPDRDRDGRTISTRAPARSACSWPAAARWVYGIEVAPAAVADAGATRRPTASPTARSCAGEVRFALPELLSRKGVTAEVVVADPPRAGFHPKALAALATLGARRIVYVSCNPATLARDVGELVRERLPARVGAAGGHVPAHAAHRGVARLERVGSMKSYLAPPALAVAPGPLRRLGGGVPDPAPHR